MHPHAYDHGVMVETIGQHTLKGGPNTNRGGGKSTARGLQSEVLNLARMHAAEIEKERKVSQGRCQICVCLAWCRHGDFIKPEGIPSGGVGAMASDSSCVLRASPRSLAPVSEAVFFPRKESRRSTWRRR